MLLEPLLRPSTGRAHGVGLLQKLVLLARMLRNTRNVPTLSHFYEHVAMATAILQIPSSVEGCVVECGTYMGGSTANLSLACALTGRRLEVFDSFEGLPAPDARDRVRVLGRGEAEYAEGAYAASLEDVRANVTRWGRVDVCNFHRGFFEETMPGFSLPCAMAFLDVDLRGSAETCLKSLWPLLAAECRLYTHEAEELHMAALFFDSPWWREQLGTEAPGLAGAGSGLGLVPEWGAFVSELGFTIKRQD